MNLTLNRVCCWNLAICNHI